MGRLIDGAWVERDLNTDERGNFVRKAAVFRHRVTRDGSSGFPAAKGRYHLFLSAACGWSHRVLIARALFGLEDAIGVSYAHPFMGSDGWTFDEGADEVLGARFLRDVYLLAQPDYTGRVTVPVLWDTETNAIVTNESTVLLRSLNEAFDEWALPHESLFPEELETELTEMTERNYTALNNGVYRAGFAGSQSAHEAAVRDVFRRLDEIENLLGRNRYLLGDRITAADWCLFPTLFRFDLVYHFHFKCNLKRLRDLPNLWAYTRELYQLPKVRETCFPDQIKQHYYTSHESINPRRHIPLGPELDFDEPHGRDRRTGG